MKVKVRGSQVKVKVRGVTGWGEAVMGNQVRKEGGGE